VEEYGGEKILCAGVIDVKGRSVDPVATVAERIRTFCDTPRPANSGSPPTAASVRPRARSPGKMASLTAAAAIVRSEL